MSNLSDIGFPVRGEQDVNDVIMKVLDAVHITVNKNTIPFDPNKPMVASGIRLGTPALTTRGMMEAEMRQIGKMIAAVVNEPNSEEVQSRVRREVKELTARFPLYPQRYKKQMAETAIAAE